jgi:hypothetical protein
VHLCFGKLQRGYKQMHSGGKRTASSLWLHRHTTTFCHLNYSVKESPSGFQGLRGSQMMNFSLNRISFWFSPQLKTPIAYPAMS